MKKVKTVRITHCTFVCATFFTRSSAYGIRSQRLATTNPMKVTAQKRSNRSAGMTTSGAGQTNTQTITTTKKSKETPLEKFAI
jgi:hypothetical protein